jgi:hypothetical protein
MVPSDKDLEALGKFYGYDDPQILMREAVVVPKLEEAHS